MKKLLLEHLGVWITLVPVALVAGRILSESGGEIATAQFLLQYSSPFSLVVGTVLPFLAPAAFLLGVCLTASHEVRASRNKIGVGFVPLIAVFLLVFGAFFSAVWFVLLVSFVTVAAKVLLYLFAGRFPKLWGQASRSIRWLATDLSLSVAIVVTIVLLFPSGLWVPEEKVTFSDGSALRLYVLGSSGDSLAALSKVDGVPTLVNSTTIVERQICSDGEAPLIFWQLLVGSKPPSGVPACTTLDS